VSNWPFQIPGVYTETIAMDETGDPLYGSLSFGGSATAYGAWYSLGESFTRPMDGIFVHSHTSGTDAGRYMVSIAVGSGTDSCMIVKDLWFPSSYYLDANVYWLPVRVPAGQEIYVKTLMPASGGKNIGLVGVSGGYPQPTGFARCEGLGMDTTDCWPFSFTPVASGTTWNQVVSSTASRYGAVSIRDFYGSNSPGEGLSKLAIGAAASEQALFRWFSSKNQNWGWGSLDAVPLDIPASSRISVSGYKNGTLDTRYCNLIGFVH
jgi:hypothetical protein